MKRITMLFLISAVLFITSCTVPQKTKEPPVSTEEPPAPPLSSVVTQESVTTEEAVTDEEQVSQMDKTQISDTYRLLTDTFSSGSFYLEYTLNGDDYVIASKNGDVYISDEDSKLSYIVRDARVTVCDHAQKTYREFEIGDSEFSYDNYVDWQDPEDYVGVEFTSVSGGTKKRPKLTETFTVEGDTVSFYYYKDELSSVTVSFFDGGQAVYEITELSKNVSDSLFKVNEKYKKI